MSNKKKIGQKFYALTKERLKEILGLRPAEKDLLLYLRVIDPFNDGCEILVSDAATFLERDKSTITRALHVLSDKGFINLEIISFRAKIIGAIAEPEPEPEPETDLDSTDSPTHRPMPPRIDQCPHTSTDAHTHPEIPAHISEEPEPSDDKASTTPKTYSDYLILLKTLSDDVQRERFLSFCERKAAQLPQPVRMLDKWILNNFDFLKAQFFKETGEQDESGVNDESSEIRKPKNKKPVLSEKVVEFLQQAIADEKIKNYWFCEPLKRWMVLLNGGRQIEVDVYFEREAIASE